MKKNNFKVAALAASIALAMSATSAMAAAPTATQLPGKGTIVSAPGTVNAGAIADNAQIIDITGHAVINWGKGTDINKDGVGGFNVGSGAMLTFNGTSGGDPLSSTDVVLNIDSSGNASQIFGELDTTGGAGVFVANANGIIVGDGATINAEGYVALIANNQGTAQDDFFDMSFNGTGGDVTVQSGATVTAAGLFVSGGGNVNVDLDAIENTAIVGLTAGQPFGDDGAFSTVNKDATLSVTGTGTTMLFSSAGNASSTGDLTLVEGSDVFNAMDLPLSSTDVAGTFTNSGTLSLPADYEMTGALVNEKTVTATGALTLGGLTNDGEFDASGKVTVTGGGLTNNGQINMYGNELSVGNGDFANNGQVAATSDVHVEYGSFTNKGSITLSAQDGGIYVYGGDLINAGSISSKAGENGAPLYDGFYAQAQDGSIINSGQLDGFDYVQTNSDSDDDAFTAGADYSVTNSGSIKSGSVVPDEDFIYIGANANAGGDANDSTASFVNTGVLDVDGTGDRNMNLYALTDLTLGGSVTAGGKALSDTNPLGDAVVQASTGVLTLSVPLVTNNRAYLRGEQVKMMADVTDISSAGYVEIDADHIDGADYDIRIASGTSLSGDNVYLKGYDGETAPNVILQGTLAGNYVTVGGNFDNNPDHYVGDVVTGPNGGILATGDNPTVSFNFTGRIKSAPYLNDGNFRYNFLPITVDGTDPVTLALSPVAYGTNGTNNGLSAVNILVNGSVNLWQHFAEPSAGAGDSAVTGVTNIPNTHLVVQSTGNISTDGNFYWPGYVYLGTIAANDDGSAAPGTLGLGMISLGGDFNNVLPGDVSGASGVHFITQFPLSIAGDVVTNANAWVNFGTDLLTQGYATGTLGGSFFGGTQGSGTVVNYGELDASMFHTHAPVATR